MAVACGKHVFGPVPSRRLGQSLGIDPVPSKTCNFNCVYCQLGRTSSLVNERRELFPAGEIVGEVEEALAIRPEKPIDWVTFIASGETCLHSRLGWMIREVHRLTTVPIAVITNGSLCSLAAVRRELAAADAVLPSLDAGSSGLFRRINRPHPGVSFTAYVDGLVELRRSFHGQLWLEIMLVRGLNDSEQALREIAAVVRRIEPDEVHVSLPTRPPAEAWVKPPDRRAVSYALDILGESARVIPPAVVELGFGLDEDVVDAVLRIITRHPVSQDELERSLIRWSPGRVRAVLDELETSGCLKVVQRFGSRFLSASSTDYGEVEP